MPREILSREEAEQSLETIRSVLAKTTRYTHISWVGVTFAGFQASVAALIGWAVPVHPESSPRAFLALWTGAMAAAFLTGFLTTQRKARRAREPYWSRKLEVVSVGLLPAFVGACLLTAALAVAGRLDLAPGLWMVFYAVGILSLGHVLDWEFQLTAWSFLLAAAAALFLLPGSPHLAMFCGFGLIHFLLGLYRCFKERPCPLK